MHYIDFDCGKCPFVTAVSKKASCLLFGSSYNCSIASLLCLF